MAKKRDYKAERRKFQSSAKAKADNAGRSKARRLMIKAGKASRGDGKDVGHKDNNPRNNSPRNLRIESRKTNRGRK